MRNEAALAIRNGSRSFALAGLFLSPTQRLGAFRLYAWCRHADDLVDQAATPEERARNLARLRARLEGLGAEEPDYPWHELAQARAAHRFPLAYARDLLAGFEGDQPGLRVRTGAELGRYAYAVAGTVGLMMCHVLGVREARALGHAEALGRAMQLTNIARDVAEDLAHDRIYLPRTVLDAEGVRGDDLLAPANLPGTKRAVDSLLLAAEELYREGERGLEHLPFRAALAIAAALGLYREIGRRLLRAGPEALLTRSVVPPWKKALLCARAAALVLASVPSRIWMLSPHLRAPRAPLPLWRPEP